MIAGRTVRDRLRLRPGRLGLPTVAVLALIGAVVIGGGHAPQRTTSADDGSGSPATAGASAPSGAASGWDQAVARGLSSSAPPLTEVRSSDSPSTGSPSAGSPSAGSPTAGSASADGTGPGAPGGTGSAPGGATPGPLTGHPDQRLAPPAPPLPCPRVAQGYLEQTPRTYPRTVALTFDDGPGPWTPKFLAVLAKYDVHATFFMVAGRAQPRPDLVAQVVDSGSLVGNHTWSHPLHPGLSQLPASRVTQEIGSAQTLLTHLSGSAPCFFRGPGEDHRTDVVQEIAHRYGLTVTDTTRTAADSVNPRNVTYDPAWRDLIVTRLTAAGAHPIVLIHDGHDDNKVNELSALERIIVWYKSRGYVFTDPAGRPFPAP